MLKQGSIIRATVYDPQGGNPKTRPLVIVTPTREISLDAPIAVVAITGEFSNPLANHEIALPYHPSGLTNSGLRKPSVANCRWLEKIVHADIIETRGFLPKRHLALILEKLAEIELEDDADPK